MKKPDLQKAPGNYSRRKRTADTIIFVCMAIIGIIFVFPFLWMTVVSFERYANINPPFPPSMILHDPSLFNFKLITENGDIWRAYGNSATIAVGTVALNLFAVMLGGYALSKGKFKGKAFLTMLILATMMVPFETRMIPMFMMFSKAHLTNTFWPLILNKMVDGFGMMMAKNFFDKLPDSLGEAAMIDGAGPARIFANVFLPLSTPIMATIVILKFMGSWNDFLWPLVILTGKDKITVPIFISFFAYEDGTRLAGVTMSVAFMGIMPVVIVFLMLQKYIIQSIALSGVKGE